MLPDLSKLAVTGVNNAGHFDKSRKDRVSIHRSGDNANGSMPCWVALTAPDANHATALKRASFALPCQLFYGGFKPEEDDDAEMDGEQADGEIDTHQFLLETNSSYGLVLGDVINFDNAPTIELVADVDTTNPEEIKAEFQVWTKVVQQQSELAQKIAECRLGMRKTHGADGMKKPDMNFAVYQATPYTRGEGTAWEAARRELTRLPDMNPIFAEEVAKGEVAGYPYETAKGMAVANWLPCLQSDVILYYVECLTDRTYPPMVGAYMLPEDPAIITASQDEFPDAFPAINGNSEQDPMYASVHNKDAPLRDVAKVLFDGYLDGLQTCPAKNFLFKRAMAHENAKPGSSAYRQAEAKFAGVKRRKDA